MWRRPEKIIKEHDRSAFIELFEEVQDLGRTILLIKKIGVAASASQAETP